MTPVSASRAGFSFWRHLTCGTDRGSIPVDLDSGNKTFSLRRPSTQYLMLHVNLSIIAHLEFPSLAFASSPGRREMKTYLNICKHFIYSHILANKFDCSVFVYQIKKVVDYHDARCVSSNLALGRHSVTLTLSH